MLKSQCSVCTLCTAKNLEKNLKAEAWLRLKLNMNANEAWVILGQVKTAALIKTETN